MNWVRCITPPPAPRLGRVASESLSHRMSLRHFILAVIGMSLRQVILAVIVGVLLAVLVLWLAPELVR